MSLSSFEVIGSGLIKVHGALTFNSIMPLLEQSERLLSNKQNIIFDMQTVTHSDSAGLSLLIEWLRTAQRNHFSIQFKNIPAQLTSIAQVCGLEKLLV